LIGKPSEPEIIMPPESLQLALFILQEFIKNEPAIAGEIKSLFTKADPTPNDWHALRARILARSYESFVPATALTPAPAPALAIVPAAVPAVIEKEAIPAPLAEQPVTGSPAPQWQVGNPALV
jgi:hypothetical protein